MRRVNYLWLWLFGMIGALACAPEQEEPAADETASDAPPEAGDDGPPIETELGGADFDDTESELEREARAEREGDEADDDEPESEEEEDDEADDDEDAEPEAAGRPATDERRPAPVGAVAADDDEFERELAELAAETSPPDGQATSPSLPTPASPAGALPLPPPGHTWALTQTGQAYLIPLQQLAQQPPFMANAPQPPTEEFDPEQPMTRGEFLRQQQLWQQQQHQRTQQLLEQQRNVALAEQKMEGHLDRYSLTRDKNSRMRRAVRQAIADELPATWTDADFDRVSRRVTQQFYEERNAGRSKTAKPAGKKPAAAPAPAGKTKTEQTRTEAPASPKPAPRTRRDEIREEERQIRQFLKGHKVRPRRRK